MGKKEKLWEELEDLVKQKRNLMERIFDKEKEYAELISPFKVGDVIRRMEGKKEKKLEIIRISYFTKNSPKLEGRIFKLDGEVGMKTQGVYLDGGWEKVE